MLPVASTVLIEFVLFTLTWPWGTNVKRAIGIAAISTMIGVIFVLPLRILFNAMNWRMFHNKALADALFIVAWPILTMIGYATLRGIRATGGSALR